MQRALITLLLLVSGVDAQTPRAVATFHNIGIEVAFTSAPSAGTVIDMAVKNIATTNDYRAALPLDRLDANLFAGSVLRVAAGTTYSIRLSSAAFTSNLFVTVTTRSEVFPDATNRTFHVSPSGNDASNGLTQAGAFRTLGHALSGIQAGDKILLYDGRYYEGDFDLFASGTTSKPIVIQNAPGAHPVLDGTDTNFAPSWIVYDAAHSVYRTSTAKTPSTAFLNGGQLYRFPDLASLVNTQWDQVAGYFADGSFLYARFPNAAGPGTNVVTIPKYTIALTLNGSQWQLRGLEICYYGYDLYGEGIYLFSAANNLVERCAFHHNVIGVAIKYSASSNTIQYCSFNESPENTFAWSAVKEGTGDYEAGGVLVYGNNETNEANVIRYNTFSNMFDGAHLYSDDPAGATKNMDFYGNTITGCADDGLETDGAGSNVRIYNNTFSSFLTGISVAPAMTGPTYIFRNVLSGWHSTEIYDGYPFKFNNGSDLTTGWVRIYHNTCFTDVPSQDGFLFKDYSLWTNIVSRNNIYAGTGYAIESWGSVNPVSFDYDALYTTNTGQFASWAGGNYLTVAGFFAGTGQEQHGLRGSPKFVDGTNADFTLKSSSPLIDKGVVIPGVNDDYIGAGPDMGAIEFVQSSGAIANDWTTWNAVSGTTYQLQFTSDPTTGTWNNIGPATAATNAAISFPATNAIGAQGFYRLLLP